MDLKRLAQYRVVSQLLINSKIESVENVVSWMGAMQAQDLNMAKWAIGIRMKNGREETINTAINDGKIFRIHALRPTWHFVDAKDLDWITDLSAPQIKAKSKGRQKELEITPALLKKSYKLLQKILEDNNHLTRKELMILFDRAKINTKDNRGSHILIHAELDKIICNGTMKGKDITYALWDERVSVKSDLKKEECLKLLAERYFQSHGPATIEDFCWWSGLTVTDVRKGMSSLSKNFISQKEGDIEYWFSHKLPHNIELKNDFHLLPAFDEMLIAYRNRSASIKEHHEAKAFSSNGIFWPVILKNGKAIGTWKKIPKKGTLEIEGDIFEPGNMKMQLLNKCTKKLGNFYGKKTELKTIHQAKS